MAKHRNVEGLEDLALVAAALGEPKRLQALALLGEGELCLCELVEPLGLSASTVSNHMAILRRAGLVETRKDGRWMHFRLAESSSDPVAASALGWIRPHLPDANRPSCSKKEDCCP